MSEATQNDLMIATMKAAADLIKTYNSGLSQNAIQTRMERIADDLLVAVKAERERPVRETEGASE